jgi:hypothetical protein
MPEQDRYYKSRHGFTGTDADSPVCCPGTLERLDHAILGRGQPAASLVFAAMRALMAPMTQEFLRRRGRGCRAHAQRPTPPNPERSCWFHTFQRPARLGNNQAKRMPVKPVHRYQGSRRTSSRCTAAMVPGRYGFQRTNSPARPELWLHVIGILLMKVVFSCVVDDKPRYARQAALWAASLLIHGAERAESLVVHTVGEGDPALRALLGSWGIDVVRIKPFDARHPHSNKLAQFGTDSLQNADYVVLCDCDLAFVAPISPWLRGERIRASIVLLPGLPSAQWKIIFAAANLRFPEERVLTGNGAQTLPTFCNGGLYIIPQALFSQIGSFWTKWDRWLLERAELMKPMQVLADQISFALACEELGLKINYLPIELNYHIESSLEFLRGGAERDCAPRVLHYHNFVGPRGFLRYTTIASVNVAIDRANELVRCLNECYTEQPQSGS